MLAASPDGACSPSPRVCDARALFPPTGAVGPHIPAPALGDTLLTLVMSVCVPHPRAYFLGRHLRRALTFFLCPLSAGALSCMPIVLLPRRLCCLTESLPVLPEHPTPGPVPSVRDVVLWPSGGPECPVAYLATPRGPRVGVPLSLQVPLATLPQWKSAHPQGHTRGPVSPM